MNINILNTTLGMCLVGLLSLSACEEAAIPVSVDNTPITLDTISFPVVKAIAYQSAPEMGRTEYLYFGKQDGFDFQYNFCLLYTSPSPRDGLLSRMPSSA